MKIGALIPARGGSKRIKQKNISELGGKPLINWSIDAALESDVFNSVTVSTEDTTIADCVRTYYSTKDVDILVRPEELARDEVSGVQVFTHYLSERQDIDFGACLLPTYPFRKTERMREIDRHIRSRYCWRVQSETQERICTGDYYYPKKEGVKKMFDNRPLFCPIMSSAYTYWDRYCFGDVWKRYNVTTNERCLRVSIDATENFDIDYPEDLNKARLIADGYQIEYAPMESWKYKDWFIVTPRGIDRDAFITFVGEERIEDMSMPLLVLEKVTHSYARFMIMPEVVGRGHFMNCEVYYYIWGDETSIFNSQKYPTEYLSSQAYRFMRFPPEANLYYTQHNAPDTHGVWYGTLFGDNNNTTPTVLSHGMSFGADILPWKRTFKIEDLRKEAFFIEPERLVKQ